MGPMSATPPTLEPDASGVATLAPAATPALAPVPPVIPAATPPTPTLTWSEGRLYRNGVPHQILSGALHYFRVHPDLWRDRLRRLADMGLNTVDTYVPWNFHQPRENEPASHTGWRDLEHFVRLAAEEGLDVVVRPGPYICAEWSNGGLPSWLTGRDVDLRSSDPAFLAAVGLWFDDLIPRLARLQANLGGGIVAVQVENEFGSFGDDAEYMRWSREALVSRGITELLFTADGPTDLMLDGGTLAGTLTTVTMGSKAQQARHLLASRRPDEPFIVAEFWNGWFDHWGEPHHVRGVDSAASTLADIIRDGGSASIYMVHGGTNFGLWAGANERDGVLQPTITSYDSDAPIAEDGVLTEKFYAMREVLGTTAPIRSEPRLPVLPAASLPVTRGSALQVGIDAITLATGASLTTGSRPASFEQLALDSGMVRYTAYPRVPMGETTLTFGDVRDRGIVYVDGARVGVVDAASTTVTVLGTGRVIELIVIVENMGRVNYGQLLGQHKGLLGKVLVGQRAVQGWTSQPIALQDWAADELALATVAAGGGDDVGTASADVNSAETENAATSGFATATLTVETAADTFLALPGFGKGFVWVNGFLLGRYWHVGPQMTYYCPAPLLHAGENTITVLELDHFGTSIDLRTEPELGPPEEYIEEFD
jgi:beta-galactosidase